MPASPKAIRDFIYVDVDQLYSFYSQVFEGLTAQVTHQSELHVSHRGGRVDAGDAGSVAGDSSRGSLKQESYILYDHMYNRLEQGLIDAITNPVDLNPGNYQEVLGRSFLVKIRGTAEVEDYDRLEAFTSNFNQLAISFKLTSVLYNGEYDYVKELIETRRTELESQIQSTSLRQEKQRLQKEANALKDVDTLAREIVLRDASTLREDFLSSVSLWLKFFRPEGLDVTITPSCSDGSVVFRGILDKRWLRMNSEYFSALYGERVKSEWVMVGKVTYVPDPEKIQSPDSSFSESELEAEVEAVLEGSTVDSQSDSRVVIGEGSYMRDSFRNLFYERNRFERIFRESGQRVEILLRPLAIYQEVVLPVRPSSK